MFNAMAIFLWLIMVLVAVVATVQAEWGAAVFWWVAVVLTFIWDHKHRKEA